MIDLYKLTLCYYLPANNGGYKMQRYEHILTYQNIQDAAFEAGMEPIFTDQFGTHHLYSMQYLHSYKIEKVSPDVD